VDCEYNRNRDEKKTVSGDPVYPDIIVHVRGTDRNLLAIEIKKKSAAERYKEKDRVKLRCLKAEYGYQYAVFLQLPTGRGAVNRERDEVIEWL
jgi:hypothetical protein